MEPALEIQNMDLTTLRAVLSEFRKELIPSKFEKAQQPDPQTLQIGMRNLKGMFWIELSWKAEAARLVHINPPSRIGSQSTLAKQLQHGLREMALIKIKQKGFERVVEFGLAIRPGQPIQRTLVIEIMGRHSNILLLDQNQRVITIGRQIRNHQSRIRPISTGDTYVFPPPLKGIEPTSSESLKRWKEKLCLIPTSLRKALNQSYQGISPSLALQIANDDLLEAQRIIDLPVLDISEELWISLYKSWKQWLFQLEQEKEKILGASH